MKRKTRNNVFETNSSSTHAICISNKSNENFFKNNDFLQYCEHPLPFTLEEYGWDFSVLNMPEEKASYLYTAICDIYEDEELKNMITKLKTILIDNGIKYIFEVPKKNGWYYVDHCSELIPFIEDILSNESKLLTYLFGDSFVVTGNDNDDSFSEYMYIEDSYILQPEFDGYEVFEKGN